MKKLVLFMVMLAATLVSGIASADKVYVPMSFHYGNTDYSQILVTNLGTASVRVSVSFDGSLTTYAGSTMSTNTLSASTNKTAIVAGGNTWIVLTRETDLFGATASMKRGLVVIQSSASDSPTVGQVRAHGFFIHAGTTPTGFIFPANYRVRTWTSSATAVTPTTQRYVDHIKQ